MGKQCEGMPKRQRLPVGVSDFAKICDGNYYYVDKTLLVKQLLDYGTEVVLFTRPRRFGKSLNMSMLRTFFEIPRDGERTARYFEDKKIWTCGSKYTEQQGKYPVINLSFLDVSAPTWSGMVKRIRKRLKYEFLRQENMLDLKKLKGASREQFDLFANGTPDEIDMRDALQDLSRILHEAHGRRPIILIDEYDAPIENAWAKGYYNDAVEFMKGFLTGGLKDNPDLWFACLTGVLRVAREGIFSGLNNLEVDGVLSESYDEFFGFTPEEVREMAAACGTHKERTEQEIFREIEDWYEGYRFGDQEIFNPWSVVNYFKRGGTPEAYWANTSNNEIIERLVRKANPKIKDDFVSLLSGQPIRTRVRASLKYPDIDAARGANAAEAVFTLLLMSGYLTPAGSVMNKTGEIELEIPNLEVSEIFRDAVRQGFYAPSGENLATALGAALESGDAARVETALTDILMRASYHDLSREDCYHDLLLGVIVGVGEYTAFSNRESGAGRYDICFEPKDHRHSGIILELKHGKHDNGTVLTDEELKRLADEAVKQVLEQDYAADLRVRGVPEVKAFGIVFSGKNVQVTAENRSLK